MLMDGTDCPANGPHDRRACFLSMPALGHQEHPGTSGVRGPCKRIDLPGRHPQT